MTADKTSLANAEARIARLEETLYFQEDTIARLNEALTAQQFQIDEMQKMIETIKVRLRAFTPLLEEGGNDEGPPPHYGSF